MVVQEFLQGNVNDIYVKLLEKNGRNPGGISRINPIGIYDEISVEIYD